MKIKACSIAVAALFLCLCASCTPDGGSIYFILENEQKQPPSDLGGSITAFDVAWIGSDYYVAAGTIYKGALNGSEVIWVTAGASNPLATLPAAGARCNALVAFGGDLWGGFYTNSGSLGLYQANGDDFTAAGGGAKITDSAVDGHQIIRLIVSAGELLIVSAVPSGTEDPPYYYCLTSTADGTTFEERITSANAVEDKIGDAVFHDGTYYAVAGNRLYTGQPAYGSTNVLGSHTIAAGNTLQGLFSDGSDRIVVSSKSGGLYISDNDGIDFTQKAADTLNGAAVSYLGMSEAVAGTNRLIIGSEGYGYYYLTAGDVLTRASDTTMRTLKLYGAVIQRFSVDSTQGFAFACTAGYGVWKGDINASADSGVDTATWEIQ